MALSTTYKLNTSRQTWEDNDVKSDFDYNIGTFLVSSNNNGSGQYPMTTFKIAIAYKNGPEYVLDAELYVMIFDLQSSIEFLPQGDTVSNFFPIATPLDWAKYGHLVATQLPDIENFFSITLFYNSTIAEGYLFDIIVHSPRLPNGGVMIADVYTYTLYQ
jgi:hypothetical protein